ncbi:hypothetical protein GCM10022244_12490 [Streptomyces gulbargensis]|uniref:Uncharacterized protein n=1 Tax=Streptomyces gulbargensis TaxID=364901 RepID=A0ABP7LME1_9ACTN
MRRRTRWPRRRDRGRLPVRDRKVAASSLNYRFSANVQVIIGVGNMLVIAVARPVPGNTADAKTSRDLGLAEHCEGRHRARRRRHSEAADVKHAIHPRCRSRRSSPPHEGSG